MNKSEVTSDDVCVLRDEGGLGLSNCKKWNKTTILKHVWNIYKGNKHSLWNDGIKDTKLKGRNFQEIKPKKDSVWHWRKLLNIKNMLKDSVRKLISNGENTLIWLDKWHPKSHLIDV